MSQHAGQFVFVTSRLEQTGVHADEAAGQGEGIDIRVVDNEEREALAAVIGLCGDAAADFVDVLGDQRIFDDGAGLPDLRHDGAAESRLVGLRQDGIGRAAHVRQLDVVGPGMAACDQQRHQQRRGEFSECASVQGKSLRDNVLEYPTESFGERSQ